MAINERATVEVQVNGEQAKRELKSLESYATSLKGRLAEAYKAGDTKQIKNLEGELKKTNAELKVMRINAKNIDVAMENLSTKTPKELKGILRDINAQINSGKVKRGTAEWAQYQEKLKEVKLEMKKVSGEIRESEGWLSRFNNGFNKWGAMAASALAALTGVSLVLNNMRNKRDDKEESADNLKALTGLDDSAIQWLTKQAELLSTKMEKSGLRVTQSSKEILDAYTMVGSAKPELLKDKEALHAVTIESMRLAAAAKMPLTEAVDGITLSMNQYNATADKAVKYTNVLAAGSKEGAATVQSQTSAVRNAGVAAASAHVSFESLVGSIQTLAEKGIKDEIAGTGLKKFFLTLQTGAKETNPAIVGFDKALENLKKKNLSSAQIKKIFGEEGYNVAKVMIDNTDKVKAYTAAVTDTNIATEQAAINSDNNKAIMAQYRNEINEAGIALMERLNPSLGVLTGWGTKILKAAPGLVDWFRQYWQVLVYVIAVLAAYNAGCKLQAFWINKVKSETGSYIIISKLKIFWEKAATAATWLYIAATSALSGKTKQAKLAMSGFFMVLKANPVGAIATLIVAVAGALWLLSRRTSESVREMRLLSDIQADVSQQTINERTEVEALLKVARDETLSKTQRLGAIERLNKISHEYLGNLSLEKIKTNEARAAVDQYIDSLVRAAEIKSIESQLTEADAELNKAKTAVKEYTQEDDSWGGVIKNLPRNMGNMLTFGLVDDSATKLNKDLVDAFNKKKFLEELLTQKIKNNVTKNPNAPTIDTDESPINTNLTESESDKIRKKNLEKIEADAAKEEAIIKAKYAKGEIFYRDYCKAISDNEINEINRKAGLYEKDSKEYAQLLSKKQDLLRDASSQDQQFSLEEIDVKSKKEEIAIVESYNDQKINRYALNEELYRLDLNSLAKKQNLYRKGSKEWLDYERQITELEMREKLRKQEEYQQLLDSMRQQYQKKSLDYYRQSEIDGLELLHKNGLVSEEEYQQMLLVIRQKYLQEGLEEVDRKRNKSEYTFLDGMFGNDIAKLKDKYKQIEEAEKAGTVSHQEALQMKAQADVEYLDGLKQKTEVVYSALTGVLSSYSNYVNAERDVEISKIERRYDDEIRIAGANSVKGKKIEEQKEKDLAKVKSKYNKKAMKIEIAQAFASMAMSSINAYSSAAQVPLIGYILAPIAAAAAVAAGMLNIATIKKQHQAQESGYYDGGFTGSGDYRREAGVVHAGEFVANHHAVNNPNVLPVLRLIDQAQKNNTIGSLTAQDVSEAVGYRNRSTTIVDREDRDLLNLTLNSVAIALNENKEAVSALRNNIDGGIPAIVTIDGERGFERQYSHYKKLKENKSR